MLLDKSIELLNGLDEVKVRGGHEWYRITNADGGDEALVEIYDELGHYGITAADFTRDLAALPKSTKTINLRINSPGGSVFDGLTIANRLREHKARVNVTVDGVAASIASVIAMAGDQVTMARGSQMMVHYPSILVRGTPDDLREVADLLDKVARDTIADAYRGKAGGSVDEWLDRMAAESWFGPAEAVAVGLADQADGDDEADQDAKDRAPHDLTAYGWKYAGRATAPAPEHSNRSRARVAHLRGLLKGAK